MRYPQGFLHIRPAPNQSKAPTHDRELTANCYVSLALGQPLDPQTRGIMRPSLPPAAPLPNPNPPASPPPRRWDFHGKGALLGGRLGAQAFAAKRLHPRLFAANQASRKPRYGVQGPPFAANPPTTPATAPSPRNPAPACKNKQSGLRVTI